MERYPILFLVSAQPGPAVVAQQREVALLLAQGKTITPLCPFIVNYIAQHPSYLSDVDEVHRQEIEALIATAPDDDEVA